MEAKSLGVSNVEIYKFLIRKGHERLPGKGRRKGSTE